MVPRNPAYSACARRLPARTLIASLLILIALCAMAACGRSAPPAENTAPADSTSSAEASAPATQVAAAAPTEAPTSAPTVAPTEEPTVEPTAEPTVEVTAVTEGEQTASQPITDAAAASAVEPTPAPSRIERVVIPAPSLDGNLVGDKAERPITVYLPPSYFTSDAHYPVIYYLPGYGDSEFLGFSPTKDADPFFAEGTLPEAIFVSASGTNELGGSFYTNSPVTGNWEDFIAEDVVSYIDANYRTLPAAESRGLAGHSMGGYGVLNVAMKHPDLFGSVYSMSPGLFDPDGLAESQMFSQDFVIQAYLSFLDKLATLPAEEAQRFFTSQYGDLGFAVSYGATFAPDVAAGPPYIDYPYTKDGDTLVRDDEIWKRWESGYGGITDKIAEYGENLKALRGLTIDVGSYDEYKWIPKGVAYFDQQLTAAGIPHQVLTYEGGHQNALRQRWLESVLPFFGQHLVD